MVIPPFFEFQRNFPKKTKENAGSDYFCPNFLQEGPINLIHLQDCYMAIWPYLCHMAIWVSMEQAVRMQQSGEGIKLN